MPVVNGNLLDFSVGPAFDSLPQIVFKPSGAGVSGSDFYFSREIVITPAADGSWSHTFASTANMHPQRWYEPYIRWSDLLGGFQGYDFPEWRLYVPLGGPFQFADIVEAPSNPTQTWFGTQPPKSPTAGTKWIKTDAPVGEPNNFRWVD